MKNIFAYTEIEGYQSYPAFISINTTDSRNELSISVRTRDASTPSEIYLSLDEIRNLWEAIGSADLYSTE